MPVVVVESPAKAKTITSYLGPGYTVLASYGHVRDLPPKDGSVDPDADFSMQWEIAADSKKHIKAIADALKEDGELILATDPDREGEAISWHLQEALAERKALKKDMSVRRVVFNAITKRAITEAMASPREVDLPLVEAYLARRALDYLVGFNLSPVLWRKLPGARSAGRVQSVALRLIVEREREIEAFDAREYWSVEAALLTANGGALEARLTHLKGKKLDRFDLPDQAAAEAALIAISGKNLSVQSVEAKPASRNPSPPFMTSTLQQEASRKFGFGARQTMQIAQRLYEAGHITYMRTDGIDMAPEAIQGARAEISKRYGENYLPSSPRAYKNKAKNAQEAHECIRPTDLSRDAGAVSLREADQRKLYDLIWKRTMACQMAQAKFERTTIDIAPEEERDQLTLRATGQIVTFDGFLRIYEEGRDDSSNDPDDRRLPAVSTGEALSFRSGSFSARAQKLLTDNDDENAAKLAQEDALIALRHFTQPPPRYTEATLVKRMEELGIGRPSTYAAIVTTIQDREYVRKEQNRLIPEDKGKLVTSFLERWFSRYVGYEFTANLENELDDVSSGAAEYRALLGRFWQDFKTAIDETTELRITDVLESLNEALASTIFPDPGDGSDPRLCPNCSIGRLSLKTARAGGAFIGCSNYPECRYTRAFGPPGGDQGEIGPDGLLLGNDDAGIAITLRTGRFGPYVQRGEMGEGGSKPERASLPKGWSPEELNLEKALALLSLPRPIGAHPEDGEMIEAGIGRYGPYIRHGRTYVNLPEVQEVFDIGMNRAMEVLASKPSRGRGSAAKPLRELGEHPDGGLIQILDGRYGPYVKWSKINATLPKGAEAESITLEHALELIAAKATKKGGKKPAKKASAAKSTAKSGAAKKKAAPKKRTASAAQKSES